VPGSLLQISEHNLDTSAGTREDYGLDAARVQVLRQAHALHEGAFAKAEGFEVLPVKDAVKKADVVQILVPDELQAGVYRAEIGPNLKPKTCLMFSHGFNIHFKYIVPPKNVNVVMIAPKGPGHLVRSEFEKGGGVPNLIAIKQDATGDAKKIALAWANGIGGARAGIIRTTFKEETETFKIIHKLLASINQSQLELTDTDTFAQQRRLESRRAHILRFLWIMSCFGEVGEENGAFLEVAPKAFLVNRGSEKTLE
jgi:hypothetical protein